MQQIIAFGGGGFSMEPENPLLDRYILSQTGKERPRVCFVPTASGDSAEYIGRFYNSFNQMSCEPSHLSLFDPHTRDIEGYVMGLDVVYAGGGSTKNMVALWREWGLDAIFKKALESGVILAGLSAGAICWFDEGVTDSYHGELSSVRCLGYLGGSACPHYDSDERRRPAYHRMVMSREMRPGYGMDDGAAMHFIDGSLARNVSSRPDSKVYWIDRHEHDTSETVLETQYLG